MCKKRKNFILSIFIIICIILAAVFTGCGSQKTSKSNEQGNQGTRTIVDMAGRTVTVPSHIKKVCSTNPIGTVFMYTLSPDKIAGLNNKISKAESKFTINSYKNLPVEGGYFGQGQTMNKEELLKIKPDIILNMGPINSSSISNADKIQNDLGIPVVCVTSDLDKMDNAYKFMGNLTGNTSKAKELGDYCKKTYAEITDIAKKIPEDKKVKVYYAEGKEGLQTDPKGSIHSELIDLVGAINVAQVPIQAGYGRSGVSMEQLLKWNPEAILVCIDQGFAAPANDPYKVIMSNPNWSNLKAVKDKKVYVIPCEPFNWFDRPPSVMRILGAKWLGNLLYPNYFKYDIKAEVKEFYDKFLHIKITDQQYEEIMSNVK
ncbi:ABC transporter substrate-binding protein [Aceticella autotrophica]|uniref:ABC transporter substrate-binding protein n=1 Tax=Aceticella autotrophica TaxID=2755338 RepID=A0A975AUV0_9THEO|nr:ABC transporter substrate-binding protein [Aceticella autotrophica]QSZ26880.1 ABC transporter substrate-binding protein [Aceticella autotrophica]